MDQRAEKPRRQPATREAYRRFVPISTRWMDNDVYGHVNNVIYYSFFDTAVAQFLIESGVLEAQRSPVVGFVVETGCCYFSPVEFPDRIAAGLRLGTAGRTSVRYEVGIFRNDEQQASAEGHFVHVYVDRITRRPVPLPDRLREALEVLRV